MGKDGCWDVAGGPVGADRSASPARVQAVSRETQSFPGLEGLGAVVVFVVILVVVGGGGGGGGGHGPEGIRTHSHLHVWFFTPSLPGCPRGALFRGEMVYPKAWFSVEGVGGPLLADGPDINPRGGTYL